MFYYQICFTTPHAMLAAMTTIGDLIDLREYKHPNEDTMLVFPYTFRSIVVAE